MDYKLEIAKEIQKNVAMEVGQICQMIEIPPQTSMGDYAFPCFQLAKILHKSPAQIASELAEITQELLFINKTEQKGGFLNFYIKPSAFIYEVIKETIDEGEMLGSSEEGKGKTILVEYSSPNIAKPFHIGHAFTTILGNALYRIYDHLGYKTVRLNHLGDYGTQFGKLISAYEKWGDEKSLEEHPINELLRIYVKFHDEAKLDPQLDADARIHFKNLEDGHEEEMMLWKRFKDLSMKEFSKIYDRLGVEFDDLNGESFYSDKIPEVVSILKEKGLLVESDGAQVVMLDEYNLPPCIILKSDGTTIYASRDVAAILYRSRKYDFYKNIYVVGNPQLLHFKQVFAVAEKMGIKGAKDCVHVGFGLVKFKNMKFSTREGNIIMLEDLLNECISKTLEIIRKNQIERNTDMAEDEILDVAEKVGLGAVIYTFCKNSRDRDIVFSWDEMLDFEGDSAPYVMYTYARCKSILRKALTENIDYLETSLYDFDQIGSEDEFMVAKLIYGFGESIRKAAESNEPFMLVRQITLIARTFNKFYNSSPILNNKDESIRNARLLMCEAVCVALKTGLGMLGIKTVERM
ncbi:MAG: arginine--tRNA ligase [Saccharofermentanales bacterium]